MTNNIRTPWGMSDSHEKLAEGIDFYGTPSHGGVKLDRKRNAAIPELWRIKGGWYEEDCDWAIACYFHPEGWANRPTAQETAIATLKHYYWEKWEQHHGVTLAPGESPQKDAHMLREANKDKFKVVAVWHGDSQYKIPEGMVGVIACINDNRTFSSWAEIQAYENDPLAAEVYFLVPEAEYQQRGAVFIIDEARHQRIPIPENLHESKPVSTAQ